MLFDSESLSILKRWMSWWDGPAEDYGLHDGLPVIGPVTDTRKALEEYELLHDVDVMRFQSESWEAAMKWLDDMGVSRNSRDGDEYSLVGRMRLL